MNCPGTNAIALPLNEGIYDKILKSAIVNKIAM